MKLIGKPQRFTQSKLRIRHYHKVGLGLESDTELFIAALPPEKSGERINEVLLTTIDPEQWGKLHRLTMVLREGQGVVAQVLRILEQKHININILETLTTENGRTHELLAILTLSGITPRSLEVFLHNELGAQMFLDLKPRVQPLVRLREAYKKRKEAKLRDVIEARIDGEYVHVEADDWRRLLQIPGTQLEVEGYSRIVMFSDTEEKYLSMFFPGKNECLLRLTVKHSESPGALAEFTNRLKPKNVNIINSYSRLRKSGESAEWRVTLDVTEAESCWGLLNDIRNCFGYFQDFLNLSVHSHRTFGSRDLPVSLYGHEGSMKDLTYFSGREGDVIAVQNEFKNYLISGYYKTGKTSFLKKVAHLVRSNSKRIPIELDLLGIAPTDFFRVVLRTIWEMLRTELKLGGADAPREVAPFLEHGIGRGRIVAGPPGTPHRIRAKQSVTEARLEYERAFQSLVDMVKGHGRDGMVLFVDEAQTVLYSGDDGASEIRAIWSHLNEKLNTQDLQWVIADASHWCLPSRDAFGVTSKMRVILMTQLSEDAARDLVEKPFQAAGIFPATRQVIQRILTICGRQPCYIQALCSTLLRSFAASPKVIDIITLEMVNLAMKSTVDSLHVHFEGMYTALRGVLNEGELNRLLSRRNPLTTSRESLLRNPSELSTLALSLEAVPGLVLVGEGNRSSFQATEMFRFWAQKRGLTHHAREQKA